MIEQMHKDFLQYISNLQFDYKRYVWDLINHNEKMIGIIGARGVGKTTYILQYLNKLDVDLHKKLYISADSIDVVNYSLLQVAKDFFCFRG